MPSQAMQNLIGAFRDQRKARANQAPPTLDERRAAFAPAGRLHPVPDDVLITTVTAGGMPAHWLTGPGAGTGRVLLFLHGGGYELGSLRSHGELAARLGRAGGMRVLFPEYRLAPEHRFPAAIDDVVAAWRWLRTDQDLNARSIAVAGDSAGGGLAVALLVALRGAGEALPAGAALMSPTVDLTSSGVSMTERADQDPISTPAMLRQFASDYLAGADPTSPWRRRCSPPWPDSRRCLSRQARPTCCSATPNAWPQQQPKRGSRSPWRSARACPTSNRSCSTPPRQPRPPSRSGSSCEHALTDQLSIAWASSSSHTPLSGIVKCSSKCPSAEMIWKRPLSGNWARSTPGARTSYSRSCAQHNRPPGCIFPHRPGADRLADTRRLG
jgi:monoterpene epsilon-lactone hydrolase